MAEPGIFEIINSTRGIKRLKSDPVPLELIQKALDAGTKAPSGVNTQPWQFVVVRDSETKKRVQERYLHFAGERFRTLVDASRDTDRGPAPLREVVDRLYRSETVSPQADATVSEAGSEGDPGVPVELAVVYRLVGGPEQPGFTAYLNGVHGVVAPAVDTQDGTALRDNVLGNRIEDTVIIEMPADAVMHDH